MRCPDCGYPMQALFISWVCDRCEAPGVRDRSGYIVWRRRPPGSPEYVFRTPDDAKKWRDANHLSDFPVRKVYTDATIQWRESRGSLQDIEFADRLFEIYPDVRYPPADNRAHLA